MPAVAALGSIKYSTGAIVGPALGGMLIAQYGATTAYLFDFATFAFSWFMILKIKTVHFQLEKAQSKLSHIKEGLIFAVKKPELLGTYIVDIVAMTFAFPTALFPEMSEKWGGAKAAGFLFSAMAAGSLITSVFSRWTEKFSRRGLGVVLAAGAWGFAIIGLGFSHSLWWAVIFLAFAGAFDNISGIFRQTIWNETIPNNFRGRLAGIEMISYMSGPLLGQLRAGWMAGFLGVQWAIVWGGVLCVIGVTLCAIRLKGFWLYKKINLQL